MDQSNEKSVIMKNRTGKTLCLLAVALLGAGWCVGEWRARRIDAEMRNCLLGHAVHVAGTLNPQMVRELSFTAADKGTPAFEFIRSQLTGLGAYCSHRGIYTMALREGRLVFGPENYAEDDPMASPAGTTYDKPAADHFNVFAAGKPAVFGPTTDEYGTFVSALAPVCDPNSGEVLMVVGIDTLATDWKATIDAGRRHSRLGSLIAVAVLLAGAQVRSHQKRGRRTNEAGQESQSARSPHGFAAFFLAGRRQSAGLLIGMGLLAVAFLAVVLIETWRWTQEHIDTTADQQARLAVEVDKALRDYVGKHIRPEMEKRVAQGEFVPEAMSTSFVARSVFDRVRQAFPEMILRFPSTNPRNPANRATPSEESLIRYFQEHPEANTWSGVMVFSEQGEKHFVWALPRRFDAGCLQCHGRPEDAPASLVQRYGPIAGFGRSAGEVSMDLAAVPVSAAYAKAGTRVWRHMLVALVLCTLFLGGIAFLIWTDAKRRCGAEEAIEKERRLLRLVIDSIPGIVCVKSKDHRFVIANETLARACGATVQGLQGRRDFSVNPEEVAGREQEDLEVFATGKAKYIPEELITYADGTPHWFAKTKVPLFNDDGVCDRLLVVATDITDKRSAEQKQAALLQKVAAINEELTHFAYVVSHDLKAPLRGVQLITEWLCADYADKLGDDAKEQLGLLQSRVARMRNLIDGILQYSRVGRVQEEMEDVDLNRLIPALIDGIAPPEHIHITVESGLPAIECEKTRIAQVFQNLLSNAVKFSDKPVGEIRVGCVEDGPFWQFSVSDNGPGIEEKYFDRIFQLFQTLTSRDEFESTGVGLALVKKIVESYGGRVWVQSEVGRGSTFLFTFPSRRTGAVCEVVCEQSIGAAS
jgi:PAS domain S-box-containing protein